MIGTVTMECPFAYVTQTLEPLAHLTTLNSHLYKSCLVRNICTQWRYSCQRVSVANAPVPAPTTPEESGPSACRGTAGSGTTGANTGTDSGAGAGTGNRLVTPGTPRDGLIAGYVDLGG